MKTIRNALLLLTLLTVGIAAAIAQTVEFHWTSTVKERYVSFYAEPHGTPPEEMSYLIEPINPDQKFLEEWEKEAQTNRNLIPIGLRLTEDYKRAVWVPFKTNLLVDFGPGDGGRWLWVRFRNKNDDKPHSIGNVYVSESSGNWDAHHIVLQTLPPIIVITSPKPGITSQPMIQLKGYMTSAMGSVLRFEVFDSNGRATGAGDGGFANRDDDSDLWAYATNYFSCLDIQLSPGTNTIVLSGVDSAGFLFKTNFVCVFTTVGDTNSPLFSVTWPQNGTVVSGSQFDAYGRCDDDPTAVINGLLTDDEGKSSHLQGFVERNGCLWIEHIPVDAGKNYLSIVATDAAGNSSLTNLMFTKSSITLYMDPVADPNQLWQPRINITGYCSDTNRTVTVSGVKAAMRPDGHWAATNVPVDSPNGGGTATFDLTTDDDHQTNFETNTWLPVSCSPAVENNALRAGLSLTPVSTNEYNHYPIVLGLTNISGQDIPGTWMLPRADARFSLRLYNQTNTEVVKQEWKGWSDQAWATNLNIHHLGKKELEQIDGIISFQTNSTARIASFNLDRHFQVPPGNYRLEVAVRMFKIDPSGGLVQFEFPPISTPLKILDQPSETFFYLNDLQWQGKLAWGTQRQGMRIAVAYGMKSTQIKDASRIEIFLQNTTTNNVYSRNLSFPSSSEQFDIALYDAEGKEVPKTALGRQQGQPLSLEGQGSQNSRRLFRPVFVPPDDAINCGQLDLNDYFNIPTPGKYRLTYQERLYRRETNSTFTEITLPMVNVPLEISYIRSP